MHVVVYFFFFFGFFDSFIFYFFCKQMKKKPDSSSDGMMRMMLMKVKDRYVMCMIVVSRIGMVYLLSHMYIMRFSRFLHDFIAFCKYLVILVSLMKMKQISSFNESTESSCSVKKLRVRFEWELRFGWGIVRWRWMNQLWSTQSFTVRWRERDTVDELGYLLIRVWWFDDSDLQSSTVRYLKP